MGLRQSQGSIARWLSLVINLTSCVSGAPQGDVSAVRGAVPGAKSTAPQSAPTQGVPAPSGVEQGGPLLPRRLQTLDVPGHLPAPLLIPQGGGPSQTWRVSVVAHGAGGRGIDHCEFWNARVPPDVVLLCLTGSLLDRSNPEGGAYFPDHFKLREELVAATGALRAELSGRLRDGGWRYVGYSQGATMGALAIVGAVPVFNELVLIEGGGENWTARRATQFKESGGTRVLLACGTKGCAAHGRRSRAILETAGLHVVLVHAPGVGHTYGGGVGVAVQETMLSWE